MNFSDIATYLTDAMGGRIDWFNSAGKFRQRASNSLHDMWRLYTWDETLVLGTMWSISLVAGYWAAQTCTDEKCSSLLRGSAAALATMTGAHLFTVAPKVWRREGKIKKNNETCQHMVNTLERLKGEAPDDTKLVSTLLIMQNSVKNCGQLKLPHGKRGDADRNIMFMTQFLSGLTNKISEFLDALDNPSTNRSQLLDESLAYWQQTPQTLYDSFKDEQSAQATVLYQGNN